MNTDGTGYEVLKHFTGSDGAKPDAGLTLSGGVLYGTTSSGGSSDLGTVFKMNTDGTGFTVLKVFEGTDGANPVGLTLSGSVLYGTTGLGGNSDYGTVFILDLFRTLLRLELLSPQQPGSFRLLVRGPAGLSVRVQRSANLQDWADWQTLTLGTTPANFPTSTLAPSPNASTARSHLSRFHLEWKTTNGHKLTRIEPLAASSRCRLRLTI